MITYEIGRNLYINLTNRCTNDCTFCIRNNPTGVNGYDLWLEKEPTAAEVIEAVGNAEGYEEFVFCGYGEPTLRLPELIEVARHLKGLGKKVRLDTNGQADLIWKEDTARKLAGLIDTISISLNACNGAHYQELCKSDFGEAAFDAIIKFAEECVRYIPRVILSVVDIIPADEIEKCAVVAREIGAEFRVRTYLE